MSCRISGVRGHRGRLAHHAGQAAEDVVRRHYRERGAEAREQRWRGLGGEIDLIFDQNGDTVFVEVKASRDFASAAARIGPGQVARLWAAAEEYLMTNGKAGSGECRFDVALVDARGRVEVVENAFA